MAKFTFKVEKESTYVPMEEGRYVFRIDKFEGTSNGRICRGTFCTGDGVNHYEKYKFYDGEGNFNSKSINSVARIIAGALQLDDVPKDFDETQVKKCVGRYIEADIIYSEAGEEDPRIYDHINCYSIEPADGFTDMDAEDRPAGGTADPAETPAVDNPSAVA